MLGEARGQPGGQRERRGVDLVADLHQVTALQLAPEGVDPDRTFAQLAPDSCANVRQHLAQRIGITTSRAQRLELDQPLEPAIVEERGQHARLLLVDAAQSALDLDVSQDVVTQEVRWGRESVLAQEADCLLLACLRKRCVALAGLAGVLLLRRCTADHPGDVAQFRAPLADQPAVQLGEVIVILSRANRCRHEQRDNLPDALHPPAGGFHRVGVTHCLAVRALVGATRVLHIEPEPRRGVLLARPLVECVPLLVGSPRAVDRGVAPADDVLVVRPDVGDEVLGLQSVLRLGRVVEARVIHDRGRECPMRLTHDLTRIESTG